MRGRRAASADLRIQRLIAAAVILTQGGIAVTGAIVRVTASGLGCTTWPQCLPGSFAPVADAAVPRFHQAVEFGNRLLTFLVVLTAALAVLAVTRARRRREVLVYAWLMPASTVVQAVIGGITVLTGLLWWTVAMHLLVSMAMVWLSVLLYLKIGEPDDGVRVCVVPKPLRQLTALTASRWRRTLVAGTMVTGAGPHAGDKSPDRTVERLSSTSSPWCTCIAAAGRPTWRCWSASASRCWPCARRGRSSAARRAAGAGRRAGLGRHRAVLHRRARRTGRGPRGRARP